MYNTPNNTNPNNSTDNYSNTGNTAANHNAYYAPTQGAYGQVPPASYAPYAPAENGAPKSNKKTLLAVVAGIALLCTAAGAMNGNTNTNSRGGYGQPQRFAPAQTSVFNGGQQYNGGQQNGGQQNGYNGENGESNGDASGTDAPSNGGYIPQGGGYAYNGATTATTPTTPTASDNDNGSNAITDGYWDRQKMQDQAAQGFNGYINDTTTIQNTQTGEIQTDVSNTYADPAIENGVATEVPTSQLPTTYDTAPAAAPAAADAPAASE